MSFVPDTEQRLWRTMMRRKYQVTRNRVQLHNRLESLLEEAHVKLSSVVSDLLGTSARRMLQALADGETDPATVAALADQRLRATEAQLSDAFRACATLNPVYRRLLKLTLEELRLIEDHRDPLKYVSLPKDGWYASFGGEVRLFYENYRNYNWGVGPQDSNGYLLTRFLGHGDIHLGRLARVFVELKSGLLAGRKGGPRPPDEDRLDIGQAFVEVAAKNEAVSLDLRLGRQELAYGDGTLVAIRELNVRREFDGLRARLRAGRWRTDGFWVRPATTRIGVFDDASDSTQNFWGLYATQERGRRAIREVSTYYLGLTRDSATFDQGSAPERRHSIGAAVHGTMGPISHSGEGTIQALSRPRFKFLRLSVSSCGVQAKRSRNCRSRNAEVLWSRARATSVRRTSSCRVLAKPVDNQI